MLQKKYLQAESTNKRLEEKWHKHLAAQQQQAEKAAAEAAAAETEAAAEVEAVLAEQEAAAAAAATAAVQTQQAAVEQQKAPDEATAKQAPQATVLATAEQNKTVPPSVPAALVRAGQRSTACCRRGCTRRISSNARRARCYKEGAD